MNANAFASDLPDFTKGRRWDHLELLERIETAGSINAAAKAMGMSYKAAWQAVEAMNNMSEQTLVARQTGGQNGGGTRLTDFGRRMITAYRRAEEERKRVMEGLSLNGGDFDQYYSIVRKFDLRTSARNQFLSKVLNIKVGMINAEVILDIGGEDRLVAIITRDSLEHLGLKVGAEAYALIKASWVILTSDDKIKTSARNRLCGKVTRCLIGPVNAEVIIELPGGKLVTAIVTGDSLSSMGIKEGSPVCALIKASHIILAVRS